MDPPWSYALVACHFQLSPRSRPSLRGEEVAIMVDSFSKSCSSMKPVNLTEELFSLTTRVICRSAFVKSYYGRDFDRGKFLEVVYEAMAIMGSFSASDFFPSSWVASAVDVITGLIKRVAGEVFSRL
ncbi:hypothetical protein Sjap_003415 [Stephania japonica]|uniref:Uncharacterized protein n=1 Tax=Stephania japonica TaxID=461633 RepID=A0AAP0PV16_9MAGN